MQLFKDKYFDKYKDGLSSNLIAFSENSAIVVLAVWDAVKYHFYDVDLGELVDLLKNSFTANDVQASLPFDLSAELIANLGSEPHHILEASFFHYYYCRLPLLLKVRIDHDGRRRAISRKEIDATLEAINGEYEGKFGELGSSLSSGQYLRFKKLSGKFTKSKQRDDEVYSYQWLWKALSATYPRILDADNISSITTHVIESCFPMFWDTFQECYRKMVLYFAVSGYFVGDRDIDELEAALKKSRA